MGREKKRPQAVRGRLPAEDGGRRGVSQCGSSRALWTAPAALLVLLVAAALLPSGCGAGKAEKCRVTVAVDIVPLAQVCKAVGGDLVDVKVLVPPGASPHHYELTAEEMKYLSDADLLVMVGLELIPWEEEIIAGIKGPDLVVVNAGEVVPADELLPVGEEHGGAEGEAHAEGGKTHGVYDPHVWLDPILMRYVVEAVQKGLEEADPRHASSYKEGAALLLEELEELHEEIARRTAAFSRREFIAFHSSWRYFARRYGLWQVGVIEEQPGREPSAGEIARLVETARERGVRAVFAEAQFNPRVAEAVAEESGGEVRVWLLDPLGDMEDPEKADYCGLMRYNLSVMEEALR